MASTLRFSFSIVFLSFFLLSSALDMSIITYDHNHNITPRSDEEVMALYESWLVKHEKVYNTIGEKEKRFQIFKDNLKFIDEHNSVDRSYKVGLNQFADITNDEFQAKYLSPRMDSETRSGDRRINDRITFNKGNQSSDSIDWRTKNVLSSVRRQGPFCESGSWAFAAVTTLEARNNLTNGNFELLSVQQVLDCDGRSRGCNGGSVTSAYQYIMDNGGIDTESRYPYREAGGFRYCRRNRNVVAMYDYMELKVGEEALENAVWLQPVSVVINAGSGDFQFYSQGIFTYNCGRSDQSMVVVGFDKEMVYRYEGFEEEVQYWILQNSWGPYWGEGGYMRLVKHGDPKGGACGVATRATIVMMVPP